MADGAGPPAATVGAIAGNKQCFLSFRFGGSERKWMRNLLGYLGYMDLGCGKEGMRHGVMGDG